MPDPEHARIHLLNPSSVAAHLPTCHTQRQSCSGLQESVKPQAWWGMWGLNRDTEASGRPILAAIWASSRSNFLAVKCNCSAPTRNPLHNKQTRCLFQEQESSPCRFPSTEADRSVPQTSTRVRFPAPTSQRFLPVALNIANKNQPRWVL